MTSGHERLAAALADRYRIERELGAGGMATVYLAEDVRHERQVALKVLRPELAAVIGAERFLAEIKTTAHLQHPHILPLLDSGEVVVEGTGEPEAGAPRSQVLVYYVMPFVEGESLRDRLEREKQLPIADAVRIATEVAGALDYAHRHGVIHRDIKPENILLHDGQALVADFGIALAVSKSDGATRMTETGMSLGTPHYMSPEQAMGERDLDGRTDVYALGCVLYEMLAGEPPFSGPTAQAIVARVMSSDPELVTTLRRTVPTNVARAVHLALQKLPADRFATAARFAEALAAVATGPSLPALDTAPLPLRRNRPALLFAGLALLAIVVAAGSLLRSGHRSDATVNRFALALPPGQELLAPGGLHLALSRDGRAFAYPGPGATRSRLWYRRLDDLDAVPIGGTDGATSPAFSPDGKRIAFLTLNPFGLEVVPVSGGQAQLIRSEGLSGGGVAWADDGYLYFDAGIGLGRIRPDGSDYQMVMPLDTLGGESGIGWPEVLPGERGVLMRIRRGGEAISSWRIVVADLRDHSRHDVVEGLVARYSPGGRLLWVTADGVLHAQRFDLQRLGLEGEAVTVAHGLAVGGFGAVDLAIADHGDLAYVAGGTRSSISELAWVTRDGVRTPVDSAAEESGLIRDLALSPDGSRLALQILRPTAGSNLDRIWVKPLGGGATQLVTSEDVPSMMPRWMPDRRHLLYTRMFRDQLSREYPTLFRRRADGSGAPEPLLSLARGITDVAVHPNGTLISLLTSPDGSGAREALQFRIGTDTTPTPLLPPAVYSDAPVFSPDGHWIAYGAAESGRFEVYVRPYPDVDARKVRVSIDGGVAPRWSTDGRELFFLSPNGEMMAARVTLAPEFRVDSVRSLFQVQGLQAANGSPLYAVAPDARRFLVLDITAGAGAASDERIVLVQHADQELDRRVPE